MSSLKYLKNVVTLQMDTEICVGCGMCAVVCPHGVFVMKEGKAAVGDLDACMECGACARNCPVAAVSVRAGVGCAYAIILERLRGSNQDCCCSSDSDETKCQ